jgi:hypothetical protein
MGMHAFMIAMASFGGQLDKEANVLNPFNAGITVA